MRGYSVKSVYHEIIGTTGYIRITSFYENTATQCQEALDALAKENIKSIVVDVRNTSEGMMEYAAKVIDLFVPLATEGNKAIALAVNKRATQWRPLPPMQRIMQGRFACWSIGIPKAQLSFCLRFEGF